MNARQRRELISDVSTGSAANFFLKQFWIPAARSDELANPAGPPVRIKLLDEKLILFRTPEGQVGALHHRCPHRGASLFFGRNEIGGLRCVYHGWKFDLQGKCVELPSDTDGDTRCAKVSIKAYPAIERHGVVWLYLGDRRPLPPLPNLSPFGEGDVASTFVHFDCNWTQCMEGDLDTAHLPFLHLGSVPPGLDETEDFSTWLLRNRAAQFEAISTSYGAVYGARRPAGASHCYWRVGHYLLPFYTIPPVGIFGGARVVRSWIPIDCDNTMLVQFAAAGDYPEDDNLHYQPNGSGWCARWRLQDDARNDYAIDRRLQRTSSYTGVIGNLLQDKMVVESIQPDGEPVPELLMASDRMISLTRRRLTETIDAFKTDAQVADNLFEVQPIFGGGLIARAGCDLAAAMRENADFAQTDGAAVTGHLLSLEHENAPPHVEVELPITLWQGRGTIDAVATLVLGQAVEASVSGIVVRLIPTGEALATARLDLDRLLPDTPSFEQLIWTNAISRWVAHHRASEGLISIEWRIE